MTESHAVRALSEKRADLSCELARIDTERRAVLKRLKAIDEAMRILCEGKRLTPIPTGAKRRWLFRKGELTPKVYDLHRESGGTASDREIAAKIIEGMGWDAGDDDLLRVVVGKVHDARKRLRRVTAGVNASRLVVSDSG